MIDECGPVDSAVFCPVQMDVDVESRKHVPEVPFGSGMHEAGSTYSAYPLPFPLLDSASADAFHGAAFIVSVQGLSQIRLRYRSCTRDVVLIEAADYHLR